MEKEIWKWILEALPDEGIANFADNYGIKISGFRQINAQQKNFNMVRKKIIQAALLPKNTPKLKNFFNSLTEDDDEGKMESLKGKSIEELLQFAEEEIHPTILLGVLLSSEVVEDQASAQEVYIQLKDARKLDLLERQGDEKLKKVDNPDDELEDTLIQLQDELKSAQKIIDKLDKRLRKFDQKNEELKLKAVQAQSIHNKEKNQWKEEKKDLLKNLNVHKGELGSLKHKVTVISNEKEALQKKYDKQAATIKGKDDEIARLNARMLTAKTDYEKRLAAIEKEIQETPISVTNNQTNLVGVLACEEYVSNTISKSAVFINTQDVLQFYVKIICRLPDRFPPIRLVTFFGTDLESWGFKDNGGDQMERIRALNHFLQDHLILFKPQRRILNDHSEVYLGKDIKLVPKSEGYHERLHLIPLPVFSEAVHGISHPDFEFNLLNQQFVGKIDTISSEHKDTPEYILWKNRELDYSVYGEFSSHRYSQEGFVFSTNKVIKTALFQEEWMENCFEHENTMFVPYEIYTYINGMIAAGGPLEIGSGKKPAFILETEAQVAATLSSSVKINSKNEMTEETLLEVLIHTTKEQDLLYDEKDLYNFHTAMKSSNLVILAGMSGTGKSKLVQAYGEALGLTDEHQITFIPVRPAWTDDADVIGYADTQNKVYRPGDSGVINTLLSANENRNKLHIICFDEMNLARVEHYFSQFLSVLEMDNGPRKVLRLYNENLEYTLTNSEKYPPVVPIGENLIFIGTVNLDESTYHFSDKLLDRANVITLSVLPFTNLRTATEELRKATVTQNTAGMAKSTVSFDLFNSYCNNCRDIEMKENELALLWEIHSELQKVNKSLGAGPRIVRQIDRYLKNLPKGSTFTREAAFDKQIVQRILTKVRGPEDQLKTFIGLYDRQTENIEESKLGEILGRYQDVSDFYETTNVLIHKAKELKLNGYTL